MAMAGDPVKPLMRARPSSRREPASPAPSASPINPAHRYWSPWSP